MAASSRRCCTTALLVASLWLFTTALAGDVNYRDVVLDRKSSYMSRYFRRLYRRQRHCDEPELADRVRMADFILTGTVRALEADVDRPDSKIARVEVKRVFNEHDQGDTWRNRRSIYVGGIDDESICGSDTSLRDSWIFLLHAGDDTTFRLNSSLIRITLTNIDRIEALVHSQRQLPVVRRTIGGGRLTTTTTTTTTTMTTTSQVRDPCSTLTCRHGARCVVEHGTPRCRCQPSDCSSSSLNDGPVCGSDRRDYSSECEMKSVSCRQQKHIGKLYDGFCDKCREKQCDFYEACVTDGQGTATCICPSASSCRQDSSSQLCGSDGELYSSECEMQAASCALRQHIDVVDSQHCDPCKEVECSGTGEHCVDGRCVCRHRICPTNYDPVCGTDSVTYPNQCTLDLIACTERRDIDTLHRGGCIDEFMGSGFEERQVLPTSGVDRELPQSSTEMKKSTTTATTTTTTTGNGRCGDSVCVYGARCVTDRHGRRHRCVCQFNCDAVRSAVCGSDGKLYASECLMKEASCQQGKHIATVPLNNCEELDMEVELCDGNEPLVNAATGRLFNCDEEACPSSSYCHRVPHQPARCCLGDDGVNVIIACDVSEFGCCPDGVTTALGHQHAGCPSKCRCNTLGSVAATCDPATGQCRCKPGVGGQHCDRCEPSYWGIQLISGSPGSTGCTPCGCNMFGSVRDDCDQMSGRCRCRPGITGQKCDRCPNGATVGPRGCDQHTDIEQKDAPAASSSSSSSRDHCTPDRCRFAAVCDINNGRAHCACPYDCRSSSGPAVCGTDGRRYKSLCHLILRACRRQRLIRPSVAHRC